MNNALRIDVQETSFSNSVIINNNETNYDPFDNLIRKVKTLISFFF